MKNVWQRYERNSPDILKGADIEVRRGEIFSLLGGNGSGKTTLLSVIAGIEKAYRGKLTVLGKNIKNILRRSFTAARLRCFRRTFRRFS